MAKATTQKNTSAHSSNNKTLFDKFEFWAVNNDKKILFTFLGLSLFFSFMLFNARISEAHDDALYLEGGWRYVNEFPNFFYTNPLPDRNGNVAPVRPSNQFPSTNVEGCCWWGRGVIQTTGRCNFGKLNKQIGAGASAAGVENVLYPTLNFCTNPQVICTGPGDLKWIAGIFFWVTEPQTYNKNGFNFISGLKDFVTRGCVDLLMVPNGNLDVFNERKCQSFFEAASGIVNRGCHNPKDGGCPNCVPGATCDPAHNVPERVTASIQALRALLKYFD